MIRVGISVEGETEEEFIKEVVYPCLLPRGVIVDPILMGGNVSLDRVIPELNRLYHAYDRVTTFYDFYGFKNNLCSSADDLQGRISSGVEKVVSKSNSWDARRLNPYVQMYEFEALLFSDVDAFRILPSCTPDAIDALRLIRAGVGSPEEINNSPNTAPSKRIMSHISRYNKVEYGALLVLEIDIIKIRGQCLRFNQWMEWLESLGESAG